VVGLGTDNFFVIGIEDDEVGVGSAKNACHGRHRCRRD
jgi:hypothetical protein